MVADNTIPVGVVPGMEMPAGKPMVLSDVQSGSDLGKDVHASA